MEQSSCESACGHRIVRCSSSIAPIFGRLHTVGFLRPHGLCTAFGSSRALALSPARGLFHALGQAPALGLSCALGLFHALGQARSACRSRAVGVVFVLGLTFGLTLGPGAEQCKAASPSANELWTACDPLLADRVDAEGYVRYAGILNDPLFVDAWTKLIAVQQADLQQWSTPDQIAFWINAYNIATLKLIGEHYPIEGRFPLSLFLPDNSILMVPGRWKGNYFPIAGRAINLDQMEHEVLRKQFDEPRIHFAIVCASIGCPFLRNEAFRGDRLSEQLESQALQYFEAPRGLQLDEDQLKLTKILDWFAEDFADLPQDTSISARQGDSGKAELVSRVARWFPTKVRIALRETRLEIGWLEYDWNLNERNR